jgi:DNA-binding MarR family transcriptional regulator
MTVAETSLEAFLQLDLTESQQQVLETIQAYGPITQEEAADRLGKYPNHISGRFGELEEMDEIKVVGKTENSRGNTVKRYDIK